MAAVDSPYILLIEDEEDHILLTRRALSKVDPTVELVVLKDGREVLNAGLLYRADQRGQRTKPLFVLLDLQLPRMGGLVVISMLKSAKEAASVPLVVLSASTDDIDRAVSLEQGADAFISKPITEEKLRELLTQYRQ